MNWKEYEIKVFDYFKARFPDALITKNAQLPGKLSGTARDIDVLLESQVFGHSLQIAVECKNWSSKLDVADIGSFIDKIKDVGISKGVMVSKVGYTEAAHQRARTETGVQLQVLDFDNLPTFYGFWANPYRGDLGAIISAPNGWVVDANIPPQLLPDMLCFIHPFEFSAAEAKKRHASMYFQIYPNVDNHNLAKAFEAQDLAVSKRDPDAQIAYWQERVPGGKVSYRKIQYCKEAYTEFTAGVQADDFFAYCVCDVPNDYQPDDLARLRYVMEKLILIKLHGVDPTDSHSSWQRVLKKAKSQGT